MALVSEMMRGGTSAGQAKALQGSGGSVAAAGSTQATGTVVTASVSIVTAADGTKGVTLPAVGPGESVILFNNSGSTCKVYPPSGAAITVVGTGLGTADAAHSLLTYKTGTYVCQSATQWFVTISA
jgi:hypothetical protein